MDCKSCASYCCVVAGETEVTDAEARNIARFTNTSPSLLFYEHPTIGTIVKKRQNGRCIFLNDNNECDIYAMRPNVCKEYDCRKDPTIYEVAQVLEGPMKKKIAAGPVIDSLDDLTAIMVNLAALIEPDGPLSKAPDNVKALAFESIDKLKELVTTLTGMVGEKARSKYGMKKQEACTLARRILAAAKFNQKSYRFYVVDPKTKLIWSGWDYKEDAQDGLEDVKELNRGLKVYSKKFVLDKLKVDPDNNKNWKTQ